MRTRPILIALAALSFAAPAASGAATRDCGPKLARTVRPSATIRVFSQKHTSYACWRRGGKPILIADGPDLVGFFRLRGRFLAYMLTSAPGAGTTTTSR